MIGLPVGLLVVNMVEWVFHKHVLHGLGKNKTSIWSPHWREHHKIARKNNMVDSFYPLPFLEQVKSYEMKALAGGAIALVPLLSTVPWFVVGCWMGGFIYFSVHRRSHLDTTWAKTYVPHHYAHHMGKDQDCNWNITIPVSDLLFGTYKPD